MVTTVLIVLIVAGVLLVAAIVGWMLYTRKGQEEPEWGEARQRMDHDWKYPLRRWARCVFSIVTRNHDYAYRPGWTREVVQTSWQFETIEEFNDILQDLRSRDDRAWDLVRYVVVARMGVGVGLISNEASWGLILPVCNTLQNHYPSWDAVAQEYLEGRRQWQGIALDGSEDDESTQQIRENIDELRGGIWQRVPFSQPLT